MGRERWAEMLKMKVQRSSDHANGPAAEACYQEHLMGFAGQAEAPGSIGFPGSQEAACSWLGPWCRAELLARGPDTLALPGALETAHLVLPHLPTHNLGTSSAEPSDSVEQKQGGG